MVGIIVGEQVKLVLCCCYSFWLVSMFRYLYLFRQVVRLCLFYGFEVFFVSGEDFCQFSLFLDKEVVIVIDYGIYF